MDWGKTLKKVGWIALFAALGAAAEYAVPVLQDRPEPWAGLILVLLVALRDWLKHRKD